MKGRLTAIQGSLRTREWTDKDGVKRRTTEIIVTPGAQVQFLEKLNTVGDDEQAPAVESETPTPDGDEIPF